MARSPVGYRSPFNKISSIKPSPMKAVDPATAQIIAAAAPGIISGISSLFGRKKRRREQAAARKEMEAAKQAYRKAYEEGDPDKVTDAQVRVSQATNDKTKWDSYTPQYGPQHGEYDPSKRSYREEKPLQTN